MQEARLKIQRRRKHSRLITADCCISLPESVVGLFPASSSKITLLLLQQQLLISSVGCIAKCAYCAVCKKARHNFVNRLTSDSGKTVLNLAQSVALHSLHNEYGREQYEQKHDRVCTHIKSFRQTNAFWWFSVAAAAADAADAAEGRGQHVKKRLSRTPFFITLLGYIIHARFNNKKMT